MTQKELEQLFSQYGRIITSRILVDQVTGKIRLPTSRCGHVMSLSKLGNTVCVFAGCKLVMHRNGKSEIKVFHLRLTNIVLFFYNRYDANYFHVHVPKANVQNLT